MSKLTTTLLVEIAGEAHEFDAEVAYDHHKAVRGARDSLGDVRNAGPPLEPDEPAHCEIIGVTVKVPVMIQKSLPVGFDVLPLLSEDQISALEKECMEDQAGKYEAAMEMRDDMRREDRERYRDEGGEE